MENLDSINIKIDGPSIRSGCSEITVNGVKLKAVRRIEISADVEEINQVIIHLVGSSINVDGNLQTKEVNEDANITS